MTKKVNIDIIAKDKSKNALKSVRSNLDSVKKSVFNLKNAFIGLGAGLAIKSLVNTGKSIENLQVRLKFLFGTAEEGAKAFDEMAKFAAKVPFSLAEIQQGAGVLSVVSKDADELAHIMKITGNVAAVTGLDFKTTSEQIQRALSAGISAADLFREKGVKSMLGFKAGATVSIEETVEAFERVFGAGGKFDGATGELAKTFEGTLSMIGDKIFNFKRVLLEEGFFPELKKQFGDLNKFMEENSEILDKFAKKVGRGLAIAVEGVANALKLAKDNANLLALVFGTLVSLKVASIFMGIATALNAMTVAMTGFNIATRKNIIFAGIAAFVTSMGYLIHKFKEFKNEMNEQNKIITDNTTTISEYKKIIGDLQKTLDALKESGKVIDEHGNSLTTLQDTIDLLTEEMKGLEEVIKETTGSTEHLGQSLHGNFNTILKETTKSVKEYKNALVDLMIEQARLEDRQFGMSASDYDAIEKAQEASLQKRLRQYKNHIIDMGFEQDRMLDKQIGLSVEELKAIESAEQKKVRLKEEASNQIFANTKDTLRALSGLNRTAFEAFKRLQIAEAIINAVGSASKAMNSGYPPPFNFILAGTALAKGMAMVAQIQSTSYRQQGGMVKAGQPYMVGEAGKELFVPNQSGKIVPNHELGQPVNVNFNITTVDASGFNQLLNNSRGTIVNMINSAVNETGRQAIV